MKSKLFNPKYIIGLGAVFFIIAIINSMAFDANSFDALEWWGKAAFVGFIADLAYLGILFLVVPLFKKK